MRSAHLHKKIGIVIQARMKSSRLPGKVLLELDGKPLLRRLCDRMKLCRNTDDLMVATSEESQDQAIVDACLSWGIPVYRGPEKDLTARLLGAMRSRGLTAMVRVTADNPLTDPSGIDALIERLLDDGDANGDRPALVHNVHLQGYPYGTGAELAERSVLETCDEILQSPDEREYFMAFARRHPEQFRCIRLNSPSSTHRPNYCLTVDFPQDVSLHEEIYRHFDGRDNMPLEEVVPFLDSHPDLVAKNAHLHQPFAE